jgi:hypothetical protein
MLVSEVLPAQEQQLLETGDIEQLEAVLRSVRMLHRRLIARVAEEAEAGKRKKGAGSSAQSSSSASVTATAPETEDPDVAALFASTPESAPPPDPPAVLPLVSGASSALTAPVPPRYASDDRNKQFEQQIQALAARQERVQQLPPVNQTPGPRALPPRGLVGWGGLAADIVASDAAAANAARTAPALQAQAVAYAPRPLASAPATLAAPSMVAQDPSSNPSSRGLATGLLAAALRATKGLVASTTTAQPVSAGGVAGATGPQLYGQGIGMAQQQAILPQGVLPQPPRSFSHQLQQLQQQQQQWAPQGVPSHPQAYSHPALPGGPRLPLPQQPLFPPSGFQAAAVQFTGGRGVPGPTPQWSAGNAMAGAPRGGFGPGLLGPGGLSAAPRLGGHPVAAGRGASATLPAWITRGAAV